MENSFIKDRLVHKFQEHIYGWEEQHGTLIIHADKEFNLKIIQYLADDEQLGFKFLTDLTAIHYPNNTDEELVYDFYGVDFVGHPNLIRIMNVDEMDYHPLRKEFPLEDQTRKDKDDEMFGRGGDFNFGHFNVKS